MIWSNVALKEEEVWYKEIKGFLGELEKETDEVFSQFVVDENGMLAQTPRKEPFFDRNMAIRVLANTGAKLMRNTIQQFGDRAIKEALSAKPTNE